MSMQLQWVGSTGCGLPVLDAHHEEFEALVRELDASDVHEVSPALARLIEHCERHFAEESQLMASTAFPAAECHISEHEAVLVSVREVSRMEDPIARAEVARRLAAELASWFEAHVTHLDSAVAHWVVKRRTGGVPVVLRKLQKSGMSCHQKL